MNKQKFTVTESGSQKGPEKKFRAGAVSATIWKNEGEKGSYNTISLERGYKDKNGQWQKTNSFRANDLPKAAVVLNKAYEFIILREQDSNPATAGKSSYEIEEIVY